MPRNLEATRRRIAQTSSRLRSLAYSATVPPQRIEVSEQVGREGWDAVADLALRPTALGEEFGPQWATYWFRITAEVPEAWDGARVDLIWDSGSEATLWQDGRVVQGLYSGWRALRTTATVAEPASGDERLELWVEMACNSWAGDDPDPAPGADPELTARFRLGRNWTEALAAEAPRYRAAPARLSACALGRFDPLARKLANDFDLLRLLEGERDNGLEPDWADVLAARLDDFAEAWRANDRSTWEPAAEILTDLLERHGPKPRHLVHAVGHAHIDTAWVWPVAETRRKIVRSTANQLALMDRFPEHRFAASSAQHYAWLERDDPELFDRLNQRIEEGRWEVVGGSWVEPDCNLPSGESLIRQILFGRRYFEARFGARPDVYWSPDTFGHNGQMPQILRACGFRGFITQKLSWNQLTHPPHNSFRWRGIDGSEVLAHLPPIGTYNAELTPRELRASVAEFRDHDRAGSSLALFGHGDGGGGPTAEILARAVRCADLRGLPPVELSSAAAFFDDLEAEAEQLETITGQLYFEYHRGTYTSQARTKRGNLGAERALHDAEAASAIAWFGGHGDYPADELAALWPELLRNQFHDILPGTSLPEVHEQTEAELAAVVSSAEEIRMRAESALAEAGPPGEAAAGAPLNLLDQHRREVVDSAAGPRLAESPPFGFGRLCELGAGEEVRFDAAGDRLRLVNSRIEATLTPGGQLVSLRLREDDREILAAPADLELLEDRPTAFDAWEIEPHAQRSREPVAAAERWRHEDLGPLRSELVFERRISDVSSVLQRVRLDACSGRLEYRCEIDWNESNRLLRATFPLVVQAVLATYGAQFGVHELTTHRNTDADLAHFEAPALGFVDLAEHGLGAALISSTNYGYAVREGTVSLSLLRAPTDPDPHADQGHHRLAFAIEPHQEDWRDAGIARSSAAFDRPQPWVAGAAPSGAFASVEREDLIIDTIKRSEDGRALVLRLHEAHGSRGRTRLRLGVPFNSAASANALEEGPSPLPVDGDSIALEYGPFEILTVRIDP